MDTTFLYHLHWNFHDSQIWSSQNVNPSYNQWDLLCLKSLEFDLKLLEFYLKPLEATVLRNKIMLSRKRFYAGRLDFKIVELFAVHFSQTLPANVLDGDWRLLLQTHVDCHVAGHENLGGLHYQYLQKSTIKTGSFLTLPAKC